MNGLRPYILTFIFYIYLVLGHDLDEEFLLCKSCGREIANIKDVIYVKSPLALRSYNDSYLFQSHSGPKDSGRRQTTVQLLKNPHGVEFELITLSKATVRLLNETKSMEATWFPHYSWTICLCPHCMQHLGWFFESWLVDADIQSFVAIILDKILNENEAESLIIQPKFKTY